MDALKDTCIRYGPYIGGGLLALGASAYLIKWLRKPKERVCGVDYPRDKVIVHQIAKGTYAPSLGHFVVKLETYLRIAKIPYEPSYDKDIGGPKHKIPWIEYNGVVMADSQLIMNFLNKEFNVDLNKHLSPRERATAWAIQKWLEEFTYWLNLYTCWWIRLDDMFNVYTHKMPSLAKYYLKSNGKKGFYTIGVGRHSNEEVEEMMKHDLRMLSELLVDKKFFMGDQPTELDCAAFGQLSQIRWHTPDTCPGKTLMKEKLKNLMDFCDRIKDLYWPDWNERVTGYPK